MHTKKVIVAGAIGFLGSQIVKELLEQGAEVTAMVRASNNRSALTNGCEKFCGVRYDGCTFFKASPFPEYGFDAIVATSNLC